MSKRCERMSEQIIEWPRTYAPNLGSSEPLHYGSKQGDIDTLYYTFSHEFVSERSERASKRMSTAEWVNKMGHVEQANE